MDINDLRRFRDIYLKNTDWIVLPDSPISDSERQKWIKYRNELRAFPNRFANIPSISAFKINYYLNENPNLPTPPDSGLSAFDIYTGSQPISSLSAAVSTDFTYFEGIPSGSFLNVVKDGYYTTTQKPISSTSLTFNFSHKGLYSIHITKLNYDYNTGFFKLSVI